MAAGGDPRTRRRPSPAFRRSPPALYAALFSPPQRSAALEVRRAGAGRDGQLDCPMKAPHGQRGREGAGPLSRCKGQAPARGLILSPLLAPEPPRPAWLPGARRPTTRIHCTLWPGVDGAPWLLPSQPALFFQEGLCVGSTLSLLPIWPVELSAADALTHSGGSHRRQTKQTHWAW
ncbi:uncharacterized protein LOC143442908 isoform X1 [Arvicanthis niloticus]|uniref:uncharacterized protein LOC143313150 isoform X1 n=1 Tax=Arvicanthis niloticus TaxID=61156 RepID=UPI00402B2293